MRKSKIVATIGPASSSKEVLTRLIKAGMDVARLNFSHGTLDERRKVIRHIREISSRLKKPVAIMADLPGPKIRIGRVRDGSITLVANSDITISAKTVLGTPEAISTNYPSLVRDLKKGNRVMLYDGLIELRVKSKSRAGARCVVVRGGELTDKKGMNLPGVALSVASATRKDIKFLNFAIAQKLDYAALSFVSGAKDVERLRKIARRKNSAIQFISKIERAEAVASLDGIIRASDGLIVARGDLGVETALDRVPVLQKDIIAKCLAADKPVMVATEMLESMRFAKRPTRAEVSDVVNAIFDGADAVMLSAESAVGKYPVRALEFMALLCRRADAYIDEHKIVMPGDALNTEDSTEDALGAGWRSTAASYRAGSSSTRASARSSGRSGRRRPA